MGTRTVTETVTREVWECDRCEIRGDAPDRACAICRREVCTFCRCHVPAVEVGDIPGRVGLAVRVCADCLDGSRDLVEVVRASVRRCEGEVELVLREWRGRVADGGAPPPDYYHGPDGGR